jgi:hypothetical protein
MTLVFEYSPRGSLGRLPGVGFHMMMRSPFGGYCGIAFSLWTLHFVILWDD